jgi:hypothetical protein
MQTTPKKLSRRRSGYALIVTLTFLGIMLILFAVMMSYTISNSTLTKRNNQYNASQAAAEAASEKALSQMTHDFENGALSNSPSYYASGFLPAYSDMTASPFVAAPPIQYSFTATNGAANQISIVFGSWTTNTQPLNSQYSGLYGLEQDCTIIATATPTNTTPAVPATVTESLQFALIPLFQFAIFYNMNLEIAAAQTLDIAGAVYSNGGLWSGSTTIVFSNTVSAVGLATNATDDPFCSGYTGSGASKYILANQPSSGNDTITMPVGSNNVPSTVEAIVNIPPTNYMLNSAGAFTTNGQHYLANEADLYLTNYPSGINQGWSNTNSLGAPMALYYSDSVNSPNYLTWCTNDYYIYSNSYSGGSHGIFATNYVPITNTPYYSSAFEATNSFWFTNGLPRLSWTNFVAAKGPVGTNYVLYMGYSFLTNVTFYDWREGWHMGSGPPKTVQAVQIDLSAFNKWLTNRISTNNGGPYDSQCVSDKGHHINSIYIYNAVPLTTSVLPAVRIVNGGRMPPVDDSNPDPGFTLATAMPLYVWGDYNVANSSGSSLSQNNCLYTEPSALMADAITILSDSWQDGNSVAADSGTDASGGPNASTTTINAACLEGIVESNPSNPASEGTSDGYSGGVENFLRMLEDWNPGSGKQTLWYNGSIIVMFPSQYATNCWQQTGYYYTAPNRNWAFDTNFFIGNDLPPLTPKSYGVIRATWAPN